MESPPFKIGQDRDRISALPDDLLLGILERLGVREVVRVGAVSTRWRHLPHKLSRLRFDIDDFQSTRLVEIMDAFTGAARRLLSVRPPAECNCDSKSRPVKTLHLRFYLSKPHLRSISHAVEDTVTRGETERFEFDVIPPSSELLIARRRSGWRARLGKQFMAYFIACPAAFRWLTVLSLKSIEFRHSSLLRLIGACHKLKHLALTHCRLLDRHSALKINMPNSVIAELEFIRFKCGQIKLVSVPKLTRVLCRGWRNNNAPLLFGYVPELHTVDFACHARTWQAPFTLSSCFSTKANNLSNLYLSFACQMIWIQPQHPKQLTAIFSNLTDVVFWSISPECDLNWTLFILEAAPALQKFTLNRTPHSCVKTAEDTAKTANVVWEPSKDLKHLNLELLVMIGFEEEDKVASYISLVMELATRLKIIKLRSHTCKMCDAIDPVSPRRSQADEASKRRIKERLTHGSSSSVEIVIS